MGQCLAIELLLILASRNVDDALTGIIARRFQTYFELALLMTLVTLEIRT